MSISTLISKLKEVYPGSECNGFSFDSVDSALAIKIKGTDVHQSLRTGSSNKDQIDLTYGAELPQGKSPVDDFFPTIVRPKHLPQSPHLIIPCNIWGECLSEKSSSWIADSIDVTKSTMNDEANPRLQLRGVNNLRLKIPEGDWLVFVHQKGQFQYEAFSLKANDWTNPSGGTKEMMYVNDSRRTRIDINLESIVSKKTIVGSNQIFFGPPGTGKSTLVASKVGSAQMFRTQFHPEYSHSDLIGSYRPVVGFESDSSNVVHGFDGSVLQRPVNYFSFVPGPLAQAIACALNTEEHVFLLIEEINRGDCAAIFGDVFQLLDRNSEGGSEFGITPTPELLSYLKSKGASVPSDGKLYLPANLSLLATMNTCDQSLYPMDSAFKRRWHWVACPIDFGAVLAYTTGTRPFLDDGKTKWDWIKLIESTNKNIVREKMEDKQIGPWFIKPESNGSVSWEGFLNKCLFYLWHDVFKDEQFSDNSPFLSDSPEVFSEMQQKMRVEGLAAVFKAELLEPVGAA